VTSPSASTMRDRIALVLMALMSLGSLYVFMDSLLTFGTVPAAAVGVEAWRMFGYVVFAGLFLLAGLFPRRMIGIWELIIFHKSVTALYLIPYIGVDADMDAAPTKTILTVILNDGLLVAMTVTAYVLAKGWRAWRPAARS
jgi:hypothetical protein